MANSYVEQIVLIGVGVSPNPNSPVDSVKLRQVDSQVVDQWDVREREKAGQDLRRDQVYQA